MANALGPARVVTAQCFISWRRPRTHHRVLLQRASAMKMPSWLKKTKNDHKASSSRMPLSPPSSAVGPPPALLRQLPPVPRPQDYMGQASRTGCVDSLRADQIGRTATHFLSGSNTNRVRWTVRIVGLHRPAEVTLTVTSSKYRSDHYYLLTVALPMTK
jgi:hypothetical protein